MQEAPSDISSQWELAPQGRSSGICSWSHIYWFSVSWGPVLVLSTFSHEAVCAPQLHGILHKNPTGKILETSQWPRPPIPSLMGGNWAIFLTNLGHHISPRSHSLLQTEIQFGFEYRHISWIHLLQCFDQKFIFLVHFSKW